MYKYALICLIFLMFTSTDSFAKEPVYFSDMSQAKPANAFSDSMEREKWQLISYQSEEVRGRMAVAHSFINAPDFTIPLNLKGWYAIYLGYWNFPVGNDGKTILKAKLSNWDGFRHFHEYKSSDTQDKTFLREVFMGCEDVTDLNLIIGKSNGLISSKLYFAYAKLVPLEQNKIETLKAERANKSERNLIATIDGSSFWHYYEVSKPQHVLDQVQLYRNSSVSKVLWAVNYGGTTNFRSSVPDTLFAGDSVRIHLADEASLSGDYTRGERQMTQSLAKFDAQGIIPQQIVADFLHKHDIKFDIMFRLGILGKIPPWTWTNSPQGFTNKHPQFNQVLRDGTVVKKSSYAFPEVRNYMLNIIKDAITKINVDGINLCFVRGPHLLQFEKPIAKAYEEQYGKSIFDVPANDPNLLKIRAGFMTDFVRDVRKVLDDYGKANDSTLTLSVWVWPSYRNVWLGKTPLEEGLDVKTWIKEDLVDSVICQQGIDKEYMQLCEENGVEFVLFTGFRGEQAMSPKTVTKAYQQGVKQFAYWDIDSAQLRPETWEWIRRISNRKEMAEWNTESNRIKSIPLTSINGTNLINSLAQSVYSGG